MRAQLYVAVMFQMCGVAVAVAAGFVVGVVVGLVVLALGLLAIGIALEPSKKPQPPATKRRES